MKPDKIYISLTIILLFTAFSWFSSCTHVADISDIPEICFDRDILRIFVNNCAIPGCHDGGGRESHMALNNYDDIIQYIVPGNPDASTLYQAIISKWDNLMPPNQPLTKDNRTVIRVWIEQGAGHTVCPGTTTPGGNSTGTLRNCR